MQWFGELYPYAVIVLALTTSVMSVIAGGFSFIIMLRVGFMKSNDPDCLRSSASGEIVLRHVVGGTVIFVLACVAAMLELRLGAWIADVTCGIPTSLS
jgi:hypothetical protein